MKTLNTDKEKYFRRIGKKRAKCEFCNPSIVNKQEVKKLAGNHWQVLVCIYPYLDGNLMIVPKRHIKNIHELNAKEWQELQDIFHRTQKALRAIFHTQHFNIALNIGRKAGNSLEHLHWQIVPRTKAVPNALNIFADIHLVTMEPAKLKKLLEK